MSIRSTCALLALALGALCASSQAVAKVSRCVAPDGAVTYTDKGCAGKAAPAAAAEPEPVPAPAPPPAPAPRVIETPQPAPPPQPVAQPESTPQPQPAALPPAAQQPAARAMAAEVAGAKSSEEPPTPLRRGRHVPGIYPKLVFAGFALMFLAWVLAMVAGFGESTLWGVLILLLSPLTMIIFTIVRWSKGRIPMLLFAIGAGMAFAFFVRPAEQMDVTDSYLTSRDDAQSAVPLRQKQFTMSDTVHARTVVDWGVSQDLGPVHIAMWIWYSRGQPAATDAAPVIFKSRPYVIAVKRPAQALGEGNHKVEIYLDGVLMDTRPFEID